MSLLEAADMPFGMGPGNHDQPTTLYNQYFPYTRFQGRSYYGGHYQDKNDNNYQLFSGGGMDFVIVHLEFCPPTAAVAWAASVMAAHPERIGIMTTHGYLNESAQRSVHSCTNTQYLWDQLAVPSPNLRFMLSGHVHDESRRTDTVGRPNGVSDAGRLPGPRERRRGLAAHPAVRPRRRQGVRADVFAVAERVRDRCQ